MIKAAVAVIICGAILTGCYDKAELNDRAYVNAISIDKNGNKDGGRFFAGVSLSDISERGDRGGGEESEAENKGFSAHMGETLSSAIFKSESNKSQKLFFGQTRAAVFGESLLKDKNLFLESIDGLERNREISRKTLVLATDKKAADVCGITPDGEPSVGVFVDKFFETSFEGGKTGASFKMNLEDLVISLKRSGNAVMPKVSEKDGKINIGGAAVINNMELRGFLDEAETRGYLWQHGEIKGANIDVSLHDIPVSYNVLSHKRDISFYEYEGGLVMSVQIKTKGTVTEYILGGQLNTDGGIRAIEALVENSIKNEAEKVNGKLQTQFKCDGADVASLLKKENYSLWLKHKDHWQKAFEEMVIEVNVTSVVQ